MLFNTYHNSNNHCGLRIGLMVLLLRSSMNSLDNSLYKPAYIKVIISNL